MSCDNQFDVIIIGTGAGGGTLAYHLAPSGKRILILERGDYVAREKDNWNPKAVNVDARYNTKELWRDVDGKELHPHTNYYVGGNTKFTVQHCFGCARKISERFVTTAESHRPGRSAMTNWSRTTRKLRTYIKCTAIVVKILRSRQRAKHIPGPL